MDFIVKRRVLILMLFTAMVMLGVISYQRISVELIPNINLPTFFVQVGGTTEMSPEQMERTAVLPIEGAIGTLEGVHEIKSTIEQRGASIVVFYENDVDLKYAFLRLNAKINEVKQKLPEGFQVRTVKFDNSAINQSFMSLQLLGKGSMDRLRFLAEEKILPQLEIVDGVSGAEILGGREKVVEILLDEERCKAFDITPELVRRKLQDNQQFKTFAGNIKEARRTHFVNITAEYHSVKELEEVVIRQDGPLLLKDIAKVFFGAKDETSYARVDGKNTVSIQIQNDALAKKIELSHSLQEQIEEINEAIYPASLIIQNNSAEQLEENLDKMKEAAIVGAILAILVLWIFLRNVGMAAVIALCIPISAFTAFNFFYLNDISLNMFTMMGMVLALGMLLDNSVVVLENIYRCRAEGMSVSDSIIKGVKEVARPVVASTLTTIAVFLPFAFSEEFIPQLIGKNVGVSVISTMLVSLLCAVLLIPMLSQFFMSDKQVSKSKESFTYLSLKDNIVRYYLVFLKFCMRKPTFTFIMSTGLFFLSIGIYLLVSSASNNEIENRRIPMFVTFPEQTDLKQADEKTQEIIALYKEFPEVEHLYSNVREDRAELNFELKEDYEELVGRKYYEVKNEIRRRVGKIQGADISFDVESAQRVSGRGSGGNSSGGIESALGFGSPAEQVVIQGLDFKEMQAFAEEMNEKLSNLATIERTRVDAEITRPEVHLNFDKELMSRLGIPYTSVARELNSSGRRQLDAGVELKQGTDSYPVSFRLKEYTDRDLNLREMQAVNIPSDSGALFRVEEFSSTFLSQGKARIRRENQEKKVSITITYKEEVKTDSEALNAAREELDRLVLDSYVPSGITATVVHGEQDFSEYYFLIFCAFLLIYMILASVFESLVTPFILLFSIPLGMIGSVSLLIFSGQGLSQYALMGVLILIGVVVNNGIILLDYTRQLEREGYRRVRAIVQAGITRIRPVLITAITTIVAMIPIAMGDQEYIGAMGRPFALTIVGGLSFSTLLTLILIPAFYSGVQSAMTWWKEISIWTKGLQILAFVGLVFGVYNWIDSAIWQAFWGFVGFVSIPALAYFLTESLKKATEDVVPKGEELKISIRHLSKVYGRPNQLKREWMAISKIKRTLGLDGEYKKKFDRMKLVWQVPFLVFFAYFTFGYLENALWNFIGVILFNVLFIQFFKPLLFSFLQEKGILKSKRMAYWGIPLVNLAYFYWSWSNIGVAIFFTLIALILLVGFDQERKIEQGEKEREKTNVIFRALANLARWLKSKWYPTEFKALKSVDLDIGQGMFGLLGPNGAGKSTLMRVICGILEQSYGKIWINGLDTQERREELQGLIGFLPQEFGMYEKMSPANYLDYQSILKGITNKEKRDNRIKQVLEAVHLYDRRHEVIGSFSGGMKQRVGIAQTLLHLPRILVVDEPTAGLDPKERIRFRNLLVELSRDRIVIFSTHILEDVASACNHLAILKKGEIQFKGTPQSMTQVAEGKVWEMMIDHKELEGWNEKLIITHHMQDGEMLRVRCLCPFTPIVDAKSLAPNLEDAYLWLLKGTSFYANQKLKSEEYENA